MLRQIHVWRLDTRRWHASDAEAELEAQVKWIGERVSRSNYQGCPQLNVAVEFPDLNHPARAVQLRTSENFGDGLEIQMRT